MNNRQRPVVLRDSTLREGLDVPGVTFTVAQRVAIIEELARAGVPEAEIVAPSRVLQDLGVAREIRSRKIPIRLSGLIYANRPGHREEVESAIGILDRLDLLMPLSERREPPDPAEKTARLEESLSATLALPIEIGAGLPHTTQVDPGLVIDVACRAAEAGARRITLYDTHGGTEPFSVRNLVRRVSSTVAVPVFFHAHDDLGLATANAWAAVRGGAAGLDVTVNGLGDRAGNASLEQAVMLLELRGCRTGIDPTSLGRLARLVAELSGLPIPKLAPVVGEHVFDHVSPAHRDAPAEFEPFAPVLVGRERRVPPAAL